MFIINNDDDVHVQVSTLRILQRIYEQKGMSGALMLFLDKWLSDSWFYSAKKAISKCCSIFLWQVSKPRITCRQKRF